MKTTTIYQNHKQRVKLMFLAGKVLTKRGLDRYLDVTNSAEIINQLRSTASMKDIVPDGNDQRPGCLVLKCQVLPGKQVPAFFYEGSIM
jgi:hypothetical protein